MKENVKDINFPYMFVFPGQITAKTKNHGQILESLDGSKWMLQKDWTCVKRRLFG